jgi:Zn-dependent peptidase ImmA (M78 family)
MTVRPGIFLNDNVPADRQRHTIAHEVGELTILDLPSGRDREDIASRFAGALLVPAEPFAAALTPPITLSDFVPLKHVWGVSISSLIMRAFHLGLIDAKRYRSLFVQLSGRGWRREEPGSDQMLAERPRAFRKMAEVEFGEPLDFGAMEDALALDPWFVRQLVNSQISGDEVASQAGRSARRVASIVRMPVRS